MNWGADQIGAAIMIAVSLAVLLTDKAIQWRSRYRRLKFERAMELLAEHNWIINDPVVLDD